MGINMIIGKDKALTLWEKIIIRGLTAFFVMSIFNILNLDGQWQSIQSVNNIELVDSVFAFFLFFLLQTFIILILEKNKIYNMDALFFTVSIIGFGFFIAVSVKDVYMALIVSFWVILGIRYILLRFPIGLKLLKLSKRKMVIILTFVVVLTLLYVGSLVVLRYYLFRTPNFDFGIFSQMYYYMKETGLPMTTSERGYYLSHFSIHFSPILYLILPVFFILDSPVTLIVMQLLIVMSGAIPIYFICKNRKMTNFITLGLVLVYILYPTMRTGLFYDFHENKFLPVLLLWLIYFLDKRGGSEKQKNIGVIVFGFLALLVKEDAAIYVACIGIFQAIYKKEKKDRIRGIILFGVSVIYFFIIFCFLNKYGQGSFITSVGRFSNLMTSSEDGLVGMLINIVKNPAYAVSQLLNKDKIEFILWTMAPLMFIPFLARKTSIFILMIPYMVMNLLTDYVYQYNIEFQYTYGSCTLLIYMVIIWFEGAENLKKKRLLIIMVITALLCSTSAMSTKNSYYKDAEENMEQNMEIFRLLETIPEEASVRASTWFVPALSQRKEIYDLEEDVEADYIIMDMRSDSARETAEKYMDKFMDMGYVLYETIPEKIVILRKNG